MMWDIITKAAVQSLKNVINSPVFLPRTLLILELPGSVEERKSIEAVKIVTNHLINTSRVMFASCVAPAVEKE